MEDADLLEVLQQKLTHFQFVLHYIDSSGNLDLIKGICEKYKKSKQTSLVYTFKLLVDVRDLLEMNADVGNLLLLDPVSISKTFQEVVHKILHVLKLLPDQISLPQVSVVLRLASLPAFPHVNYVQSVGCLTRVLQQGGVCLLRGIVTGVTAVSQYTQSARYFCQNEACEGNKGNNYIRVHVAGASEAQIIRNDFTCTYCYTVLQEEKSSRTLSDRLVAEVIPEEALTKSSFKSRQQIMSVYIRDDLTRFIQVGQGYEIIGVIRKDVLDERICPTIEANNLVQLHNYAKRLKDHSRFLPRNMRKLYRDRKSSPWSFVQALAYYFGGFISPPGSYFKLKLSILLSLMSLNEDKCYPLHLLVIGQDTEVIGRLLRYGLMFSRRSMSHSSSSSLAGRVIPDHYKTSAYFIEGGLLHLSHGGICYVGDTGRLKKFDTEKLQSALNGGRIVVDISSKFTGGLPHQVEQPLRCCVWGYTDPVCQRKQPNMETDNLFSSAPTGDTPKGLLDSFNMLCFPGSGDRTTDDEMNDKLVEETLKSAMETSSAESSEMELPLTAEDFYQMLVSVDKFRPKICKDTETLIYSYYLACRKSRSTDMSSSSVPVAAYQAMISLAYSHAKLSLRCEVTVSDALMAIKLYEEALTARFGFSVLSVQPQPHLSQNTVTQCLGPENDKMMNCLYADVMKFCSLATGYEE